MQINYRKLCASDIVVHNEELTVLLKCCIEDSKLFPTDESFYINKLKGLEEYLTQNQAYVVGAFDGNSLVGFIWAYNLKTEFECKLHIAYVAVCAEYRGMKIGSALLEAAEKEAIESGINVTELIVSAGNTAAIGLYEKHNYTQERIIMHKRLGEYQ